MLSTFEYQYWERKVINKKISGNIHSRRLKFVFLNSGERT